MVTRLTQKYKITCDRCGKEVFREEHDSFTGVDPGGFHEVSFTDENKYLAKGDVCGECYQEFCELSENFFDEVNRVNEMNKDKPQAILKKRSPRSRTTLYACPLCSYVFESREIDPKDMRCPHCKEELGGII